MKRFLLLTALAWGVCQFADAAALQITVTNHQTSGGFYFTPVAVAFHDGGYDLFDPGTAASAELEALAEGGATDPLVAALGNNGDGTARNATVVTAPDGFAGAPVFDPGDSATQIFDVANTATNRYLTFGSMVIPSNDAFFGNGDPFAHEVFATDGSFAGPVEIRVFGSSIYDAGTEVDDGLGAAFSANGGDATDEGGVVELDSGLAIFVGTDTAAGTTLTSGVDGAELLATISVADANAVPEPTTMAIWGAFALIGGVVSWHRNRQRSDS